MLLPDQSITRLGALSALLLPGCNSIWHLSVAWGIPRVIAQPLGFYDKLIFIFVANTDNVISISHFLGSW